MKRILVPTDFSNQAEQALKVAANFARKYDCKLYVLHTMEMPLHLANASDSTGMPESLYFIKLAKNHFKELFQKPYLQGLDITDAIGHNEIFEDIKEAALKNDIDLIIMGSHGASGFKEMFIGSNTEKVVRTSETPVLVIKNTMDELVIDDFIFATDFSDEYLTPVRAAVSFAATVNARLHLLFVNTPSDFKTNSQANEMMQRFTQKLGEGPYSLHVYNETTVEKGILAYAKEIKAQLIGMSTHGRMGLSHFFNGSISEDLVNHANLPVITFKV